MQSMFVRRDEKKERNRFCSCSHVINFAKKKTNEQVVRREWENGIVCMWSKMRIESYRRITTSVSDSFYMIYETSFFTFNSIEFFKNRCNFMKFSEKFWLFYTTHKYWQWQSNLFLFIWKSTKFIDHVSRISYFLKC
jgi:hypothetical protein